MIGILLLESSLVDGLLLENVNEVLFLESFSSDNFINLFIHSSHTMESLDLFIKVPEPINQSLEFFINGFDIKSNNITLFIDGHISNTQNINLFINGKNVFNNDIILFISTFNIDANMMDLFISGPIRITDNVSLFINGMDLQNDNINLFIHGNNNFNNNINLLINGLNNNNKSLELFIYGFDIKPNNIILYVNGHVDNSSNIILVINPHAVIDDNITLFIRPPQEASSISLIINGIIPILPLSCPILDPNSTIQIPSTLITIYQSYIDSLINQLGKHVLLEFDSVLTPCPNCEFDLINQRSRGIYISGGPISFSRGSQCPYCKGNGLLETKSEKCIIALTKWSPKEINDFNISVNNDKAIVRLKAFLSESDNLIRAKTAIIEYDQRSLVVMRARMIRGIVPIGLRDDRYCTSYWELI